tara:strand:- start:5249 stop:7177 length:1929 start_codon:yes stop_codon:yes gene_type:complete
MAGLTSKTIASTYHSILKTLADGGITTSLQVVEDGAGDDTCLQLSTKQFLVKSATDIDATFDVQNSSGHQLFTIDTNSSPEEVVINEGGLTTIDFRVEGSSAPNALKVDGTNGYVGIGTGTPEALLTLSDPTAAKIVFHDSNVSGAGEYFFMENSGGQFNMGMSSDASYSNIATKLIMTNAGKLGLGTTPDSVLHVRGSQSGFSAESHHVLENSNNTNGDYVGTGYSTDTGGASKAWFGLYRHSTYGRGDFTWCIDAAADTSVVATTDEVMRLNNPGNLGLGTTTPGTVNAAGSSDATYLDVDGGSYAGVVTLRRQTSTNDHGVGIIQWANTNNGLVANNAHAQGAVLAMMTTLAQTDDSNAGNDSGGEFQIHVKGRGGVEVGDQQNLQKRYAIKPDGDHIFYPVAGSSYFAIDSNHSSNTAGLKIIGAAGATQFNLDGHNCHMYLKGAGSSSTDTITLGGVNAHGSMKQGISIVNGTAASGTHTNTASIYVQSGELNYIDASGNAATLDSLSDERTKDNITVIPDALTRLAKLKGVTFNYVDYKDSTLPFKDEIDSTTKFGSFVNYGANTRVGIIAQDVQECYDGLGITNAIMKLPIESPPNASEYKKYGEILKARVETLVPLLIEAIKELSAKVTALENA